MVCTADDLLGWKDFPKGLRVLLFAEDSTSAAELRSKLESMDYIVYTFCNEDEALSAVSKKPESFHVAIVEVSTSNKDGSFKFLETVKHLPTIMTSSIHCLSTMMKCIALGAVEFLQKPLSEDKLRNIWQHVVHKAFNAAGGTMPESLKPVKDSMVSRLQLQIENGEHVNKIQEETEVVSQGHENDCERSSGSDKYPAPSTPQLKHGSRLLHDGDCQDQMICSSEKENGDPDVESKFVETTCGYSAAEVAVPMEQTPSIEEAKLKEEEGVAHITKNEADISPQKDKVGNGILNAGNVNSGKVSSVQDPSSKVNRKKTKVDWTPELHKKFVQAVEKLGIDQAIPSRILELMKVEGLTRHNVASHLQKYRLHRRHILPKEDDRRWTHPKDPMQRSFYPHKPIMAFPPYHSNPAIPAGPVTPVYPMWGPHNCHPASVQMWNPPAYPSWPPPESWQWKAYPGMHADAWGCPVMPAPHGLCTFPQSAPGYFNANPVNNCYDVQRNSLDHHPAEEVIDKVVKEAINKPWLPLPLGLKPPSTESVLAELGKQGISSIPPHSSSSPH